MDDEEYAIEDSYEDVDGSGARYVPDSPDGLNLPSPFTV